MSWTLAEIASTVGGRIREERDLVLDTVSSDSRTLGSGSLFVAIVGEHHDGHDFLEEAVQRGATAALVSRNGHPPVPIPTIRVEDTVLALGALARARRAAFRGPVLAITGSNGKTTTKEMCADVLAAAGVRVRRSPGSFNNHIGLPLSILGLQEDDQALVLELGMNHPGEIDALAGIAEPDVAAITQVAPAHLGGLGSLEAVARAKGELFDHVRPGGAAVVNLDDPRVCGQAGRFAGRHLGFGFSRQADLSAEIQGVTGEGSVFVLRTPAGRCRIRLHAHGRHLVENALCACAAAWASDLLGEAPLEAARKGLERFRALPGRLHLLEGPGGLRILDDSYNANPHSTEAALRALAAAAGDRRTILVLGDMLELGPRAPELHAEIGRLAAELGVHAVIGLGSLAERAVRGARDAGARASRSADDPEAAATAARELGGPGGTVLVKGSRGMHMERVVAALAEES